MTPHATAARPPVVVLALVRAIDAVNERVGRWSAWLALLLVAIVTYDVVMRYLFNITYVFIQELEWHLFAVMFLMTAGYAHLLDSHVRVDIFYVRLSPRARAWIDLFGGILFLFPTAFLLIWTSIPFVRASLADLEGSPDPGGIPGRFVLKAVIPLAFFLLGIQGISETIKNFYRVMGQEAPR
ncbi:MAG TPA: TRAP transporter small permease subunit [Methylomirabilota bacterium]|nr:TRAP transporter small permease subunit [Methylomirabilota bacterium]